MGLSPTIKKFNLFEILLTVLPEFSSINDLTSALLIPLNFPVTRNDLLFNKPFFCRTSTFFITKIFPNLLRT